MHRRDLKTGKGLMQDADSGPSLFPVGTNQAVDREMDHHSPELPSWLYIKSSLKAPFQCHPRTLVPSSSAFEFAKASRSSTKRPRTAFLHIRNVRVLIYKKERFAKILAIMTLTDSLDNTTHRATATPFNFSLLLSFLAFSFPKWPV
jgi:hypothetical protein